MTDTYDIEPHPNYVGDHADTPDMPEVELTVYGAEDGPEEITDADEDGYKDSVQASMFGEDKDDERDE